MQCWQTSLVHPQVLRFLSWLFSRLLQFFSWKFSYPHKEFYILYLPHTHSHPSPQQVQLMHTPTHIAVQVPALAPQIRVPATRTWFKSSNKKKSSRFRALCDVYDTFNDHSNRFSYSLYRISVEGRVFMKTQVKITWSFFNHSNYEGTILYHLTAKMTCGLKSLTLVDSKVITIRMPQVRKCRLSQNEICI